MKKNKMLRLASALLVLTLLSTSIIGGTFAKYVTTESGTDTARVAKFGVVATVSGDLFGSTYTEKVVTPSGGNTITSYSMNGGTVSAAAVDSTATTPVPSGKVVAPGTENKKGLNLSVTGTPEVKTQVTLGKATGVTDSDIYLNAGEYGVMVEYTGTKTAENIDNYYTLSGSTYTKATDADLSKKVYELRDTANVESKYYPLTWYVDEKAVTGGQTAITTALESTFTADKTFAPNTSNNLSATVGWEWMFQNADTDVDKKDTILGDMISAHLDIPDSFTVVKKDAGAETYSKVRYKVIDSITVAYADDEPSALTENDKICACLTVAYSASITVEQVD